ncbi:MAG: FtsB family cell division protein [Hyphomicrobiaceae bacterium]
MLLSCLGLTGYFVHHALYGRHGLETRTSLISRSAALEFEIKGLETVRSSLRRDVVLLAPDRPDPDIVEEIARDVLGLVHPSDKILVRR